MKRQNAFTLIEVLVTLGILMILITVVIGIINPVKQRNRAEDAVLRRTMGSIATALETFYNLNGRYPLLSDSGQLNLNTNVAIVTDNAAGGTYTFNAEGVDTPIILYLNPDGDAATPDACMHAQSNEDSTVFLRWDAHGAVLNDTDDCAP